MLHMQDDNGGQMSKETTTVFTYDPNKFFYCILIILFSTDSIPDTAGGWGEWMISALIHSPPRLGCPSAWYHPCVHCFTGDCHGCSLFTCMHRHMWWGSHDRLSVHDGFKAEECGVLCNHNDRKLSFSLFCCCWQMKCPVNPHQGRRCVVMLWANK